MSPNDAYKGELVGGLHTNYVEHLRQVLGMDAENAEWLSMEEMNEAAEAIDNTTDEKGGLLFKVETTDMCERLVRSDEGKAARIREVIKRHLRNQGDEGEIDGSDDCRLDNRDNGNRNKNSDNDWKNFNIQEFIY